MHIDFAPLYRSSVGFDRLANLIENASNSTNQNGYPPYNIELLDENNYRITMAVAGFSDADMYSIDVEYWTRLLAEGKRYYIAEVLSSFRVWPNSASVRLFGSQSRSMHTFFQRLEKQFPEAISPADVRIGAMKSALLELARGGFYTWMKLKNK